MHSSRWLLGGLAVLVLAACGNRFSASGAGGSRGPVQIPDLPPLVDDNSSASGFAGIGRLSPTADGARVEWDPVQDSGTVRQDVVYELYLALAGQPLDFTTPFLTTAPADSSATLAGLALGTEFEVAIRAVSLSDPTDVDQNCVRLAGTVARLWYVDRLAPAGGDGASPTTPLSRITDAIVGILGSGAPGHVLIAGGTYAEALAVLGDMHLHGAYSPDFAQRDRSLTPTLVRPTAGSAALRVLASARPTFVDGMELSGGSVLSNAVDVRNADLQVSNSSLFDVTSEGLTGGSSQRVSLLRLHRVQATLCGREGIQLGGSYLAELISSRFFANGTEGVEFDDLSVQKNGLSRLWVRGCEFLGNGDDGLDVDLDELDPAIGGTSREGVIEVLVERSRFEDNEEWGLLLDVDFQDADKIDADMLVWNCRSSRNGREGILLDGDAESLFALQGNVTSANRGRGLSVTSEDGTATVLVTNHWDQGSGLQGVGVDGPAHVFLSHVAVTGSFQESVLGNGSTQLVNGALWLAAPPIAADVTFTYSDLALPGTGNFSGLPELNVAPFDRFFLAQAATSTSLTVPATATLDVGDVFEFEDDGVARTVQSRTGAVAQFEPAASPAPTALSYVARFAGPGVEEDARLIPGSSWVDAGDGLERDADGSVTDVGVEGGELMEFAPEWTGRWRPLLVDQLVPGPGLVAAPLTTLTVSFTEDLDPATLNASSFVVLLDGSPVSGSAMVISGELRFTPAAPLPSGLLEIQLHRTLASLGGAPLSLPLRYHVEIR